jgi:hypothetical protein
MTIAMVRHVSAQAEWISFSSVRGTMQATIRRSPERQTQSINRISADDRGAWMEPSVAPALDAMARVVAFSSRHPMNATDRRNDFDLFIVTR